VIVILAASAVGGISGGTAGAVVFRVSLALQKRNGRKRLLRFHPFRGCAGHVAGSQDSLQARCPDVKAGRP